MATKPVSRFRRQRISFYPREIPPWSPFKRIDTLMPFLMPSPVTLGRWEIFFGHAGYGLSILEPVV